MFCFVLNNICILVRDLNILYLIYFFNLYWSLGAIILNKISSCQLKSTFQIRLTSFQLGGGSEQSEVSEIGIPTHL